MINSKCLKCHIMRETSYGQPHTESMFKRNRLVWLHDIHNKKAKYSRVLHKSRVEYFTTTVVYNLLYYLGTQPILT